MEGLTLQPASPFDFADVVGDDGWGGGVHRRRDFGRYARQVSEGVALTVREAETGRLALVVGIWPEEGYGEVWFGAGPALRDRLLPTLRLARGALAEVMAEAAPMELRCFIHPDSVAGARLASWFGFSAAGTRATRWGEAAVFSRRYP